MSEHDYEHLIVSVEDGVATLTFNRPDRRNAFNFAMDREVTDALWALDRDEAVRAIVVTGAGRAFCAGIDMSDGAAIFSSQEEHDATTGSSSDTLDGRWGLWRMATPVIGAINGAAIGAGLTLSLLFDFRVVADDAKLQFSFTRLGILPDANSTWLLPRLVGTERALDLLLTGRRFTGAEAAQIGLALASVPAEDVLKRAQELAREIGSSTSGMAVGVTKQLVYHLLGEPDRRKAMELETKLVWWSGTQPDILAGVMAQGQRTQPEWAAPKHPDLPEDLRFLD